MTIHLDSQARLPQCAELRSSLRHAGLAGAFAGVSALRSAVGSPGPRSGSCAELRRLFGHAGLSGVFAGVSAPPSAVGFLGARLDSGRIGSVASNRSFDQCAQPLQHAGDILGGDELLEDNAVQREPDQVAQALIVHPKALQLHGDGVAVGLIVAVCQRAQFRSATGLEQEFVLERLNPGIAVGKRLDTDCELVDCERRAEHVRSAQTRVDRELHRLRDEVITGSEVVPDQGMGDAGFGRNRAVGERSQPALGDDGDRCPQKCDTSRNLVHGFERTQSSAGGRSRRVCCGWYSRWTMKVTIRPILEREVAQLDDFLYLAIHQPDPARPIPRSVLDAPEVAAYTKDWGAPDDRCLVAVADGPILGAVWTRILAGAVRGYGNIDAETPEFTISVRSEHRGKGIGTRLMQRMLEVLAEQGYRQASLSVQKSNPALSLYERFGFRRTADHKGELIMVRSLSTSTDE